MAGLAKATTLTPSDSTRADVGTYLCVDCTVAGNVKVEIPGGSFTFAVAIGTAFYPLAVIRVYSTGTTATATYTSLR